MCVRARVCVCELGHQVVVGPDHSLILSCVSSVLPTAGDCMYVCVSVLSLAPFCLCTGSC